MLRAKLQFQFDLAKAGLRAIGETLQGELDERVAIGVAVFTRRVGPTDARGHHYVTPDGRIWIGATFGSRQNPGAAVRDAILDAGRAKPPHRAPTRRRPHTARNSIPGHLAFEPNIDDLLTELGL